MENEQHIYNHFDTEVRLNVKVEKNTKGYSWEATVIGATSVDQAMNLLRQLEDELKKTYGAE